MKNWQIWLLDIFYFFILIMALDIPEYVLRHSLSWIWFDIALWLLVALGAAGAYLDMMMRKRNKKKRK